MLMQPTHLIDRKRNNLAKLLAPTVEQALKSAVSVAMIEHIGNLIISPSGQLDGP